MVESVQIQNICINIRTSGETPLVDNHSIIWLSACSLNPCYVKNMSYCDYIRPEVKNVDIGYVKRQGMDWFLKKDSLYEDANTVYNAWMDFRGYMNQFSNPRLFRTSWIDTLFLFKFHYDFLKIVHGNDKYLYPWLYPKSKVNVNKEQRK
jgi:hypothetical protein